MVSSYQILSAVERTPSDHDYDAFATDVLVGLSALRKFIPSKYFYDARGSELFRRIADLPEYYLSRCEREILTRDVGIIARRLGHAPFNLVELGPGCCDKTRLLLEHLSRASLDFRYVPIDISESSMQLLASSLDGTLPRERVTGLVADYQSGLKWLGRRHRRRNLVLFLGSSIGNFTPQEAGAFMANLWGCLAHGDLLLIGFDLKKDIDVLLRAYNDSQGVTAEFNLNLLTRINRELGGHFRLDKFRHFGTYNAVTGAMESYLVSTARQSVWIEEHGRFFSFEPWEPVHTEYSYKYSIGDIEQLARANGFQIRAHLSDEQGFFVDSIWQVDKPGRVSGAIKLVPEEGDGSALHTGQPELFIQGSRAAHT
jgi:L-histidine N-alpha-methyltransferase